MERYEYSKVHSKGREIRLMTLLPREGSDDTRVTLEDVTLDPASPPSYEALSYAWGSAQDTVSIRIRTAGGIESPFSESMGWSTKNSGLSTYQIDRQFSSLEVTRKLAVALGHLRYDRKPRVLWIDAICINQQDVQERSAQVQLMGDIYRSANRTTVWLGPEEDNSSLAIETLDNLGSRIAVDWYNLTCLPGEKSEDGIVLADIGKHLPFDQKQWTSIARLLERPWFERLWIWQEVRLAKLVVVVCGFKSIHWDRLRKACLRVWQCDQLQPQLASKISGLCFYDSSNDDRNLRENLLFNLQSTRQCKCTDQRDRIYALLNISSLRGSQSLGDQPLWIPDYGKDVQSVFQGFVLRAIEETRFLKPLILCNLQEPLPNAPSWVPNLPTSMLYVDLYHLRAAGHTRAQVVYQGHGILEVFGAFITTVGDVVYINDPVAGWENSRYRDTCKEISRLASLILPLERGNLYPGGSSLVEAFCRTIFCNYFAGYEIPSLPGVPPFQPCFDELLRLIKGSGDESTRSSIKNSFGRVRRTFKSRNFFTTSEGYIGLVPLAARRGDKISVLLGCNIPLVLRPTVDGSFIIVGQCYLHGFGDGEALFGPLPLGWERVLRDGGESFINRATGAWYLTDPRLGELPDGWQMVSDNNDDRVAEFIQPSTARSTWDDPGQTPEAIRARGVDLRVIPLK